MKESSGLSKFVTDLANRFVQTSKEKENILCAPCHLFWWSFPFFPGPLLRVPTHPLCAPLLVSSSLAEETLSSKTNI